VKQQSPFNGFNSAARAGAYRGTSVALGGSGTLFDAGRATLDGVSSFSFVLDEDNLSSNPLFGFNAAPSLPGPVQAGYLCAQNGNAIFTSTSATELFICWAVTADEFVCLKPFFTSNVLIEFKR
jgi:hypothetical protein